jgi:anti-sigma B factor antagonist
VLVEMGEVSFLASMGIHTLLSGARAVRQRGGQLVLLRPNENVTELLKVSGLLDYMPVFQVREEALAALAGSG